MSKKIMKEKFKLNAVKPSPDDERDLNYHLGRFVTFEEPLPKEYNALHQEIRSQGSHGSCVGFGSAGALGYLFNLLKPKPIEPPKPTEVWFKGVAKYKRGLMNYFLHKPVYVLIDDYQEYTSDSSGRIAVKVNQEIVDKGSVSVKCWIKGYKLREFTIDFTDHDESRMIVFYKGQSEKPEPIYVEPPEPIEPEEEEEQEEEQEEPEVIPDNVPDEILPKEKNFLEKLIEFILSLFKKKTQKTTMTQELIKFSPKYMYSKCKELDGKIIDNGTYPVRACEVALKYGCVLEEDCPYTKPIPEQTNPSDDIFAEEYKISSYHRLNSVEEIKRALFNGFGVFFAVRDANLLIGHKDYDFPNYKKQSRWSAHAMQFVGWDSVGLIVRNSWGERFGSEGFGRIPYESEWLDSKVMFDVWALKKE